MCDIRYREGRHAQDLFHVMSIQVLKAYFTLERKVMKLTYNCTFGLSFILIEGPLGPWLTKESACGTIVKHTSQNLDLHLASPDLSLLLFNLSCR